MPLLLSASWPHGVAPWACEEVTLTFGMHVHRLRGLLSQISASAFPGPRKARPMPEPAEVRRQRVAYKQQVHELRLQYAKELQAKESKLQEVRKAAASATARGMSAPNVRCRSCECNP